MANLVNKVQLPNKCSICGNKMFRLQYTEFGDRHIHSLDYCPECDKEREFKLMREMDSERAHSNLNRNLSTILLFLGIAAALLYILAKLKIVPL